MLYFEFHSSARKWVAEMKELFQKIAAVYATQWRNRHNAFYREPAGATILSHGRPTHEVNTPLNFRSRHSPARWLSLLRSPMPFRPTQPNQTTPYPSTWWVASASITPGPSNQATRRFSSLDRIFSRNCSDNESPVTTSVPNSRR